MPYILTLQLKRFDFDYNTMRRIKIKDRVSFEQVLEYAAFSYSYMWPSATSVRGLELLEYEAFGY